MKKISVTYHGHACFSLESDGYRTVIDPYKDGMVDGLPPLKLEAEAVFCSHDHADHAYTEAVSLIPSPHAAPYTVESIETPHDDQGGSLRGMNWIRIFDFDGFRIAHLGDLGEIPGEKVMAKLKELDCMLIPVGGFYTIDSAAAQKIIASAGPRVTIPMHYRTDCAGFDVLSHLSDFTDRFDSVNTCDNTVVLTKDTPNQILVVNYKP